MIRKAHIGWAILIKHSSARLAAQTLSISVWPPHRKRSYLLRADANTFVHPFCFLCLSAVILGVGELSLEPVFGGEEAVTSQHWDQPHDLWPLPHTHKAEHRWTQGKDTQMQTCYIPSCCVDGYCSDGWPFFLLHLRCVGAMLYYTVQVALVLVVVTAIVQIDNERIDACHWHFCWHKAVHLSKINTFEWQTYHVFKYTQWSWVAVNGPQPDNLQMAFCSLQILVNWHGFLNVLSMGGIKSKGIKS